VSIETRSASGLASGRTDLISGRDTRSATDFIAAYRWTTIPKPPYVRI
jgi:hypothetical protein